MKKAKKYFLCLIIAILVILFLPNKSNAVCYFETSKYKITEGKEYLLTNLNSKDLKVKTILKNVTPIRDIYEVCAFKANGQKLSDNQNVGTASYLRLRHIEYDYLTSDRLPIIVYGDTNGDGNINSADALAIIKNKLGKVKFSNGYFLEAGRITESTRKNNAVPNSADALAIIKYRLGKADISQYYQMRITVSSYEDLYTQLKQCNTNIEFDKNAPNYNQMVSDYNKLQDIVKTYCKDSMSQTTKALVLHDYLVAGTKLHYDIPYNSRLDENESEICNIGKTMNQIGFAKAYTDLLGIAGIPSRIVSDVFANHPDTAVNEVTIDGELYYVACGADSYISEVEGKGKIRRYFFLRNTEQLKVDFWEDDASFYYKPDSRFESTSTKYVGVTWPEYREALDYKDSEIKTVTGKKIIRDVLELKKAVLNGEEYAIDVIDSDSQSAYEIDERCKRIVAKYIKPDMTIEEKLLTIHDYICSNFVRNDNKMLKGRTISNKEYDCAWGHYKNTILSNMGDCWTITTYFNTLCAYIGVETQSVHEGLIPNNFGLGAHMWSLVKLGDYWYHVDCEGGDYYCYGEVDRLWFLYSDQAMRITKNTYEPCTSTKYDTYPWPEFKGLEYYQDVTGIVDENIPTTYIGVNEKTNVAVGDVFNVQARVFPYGSSSKVTYSSSNPKVATVDTKGNVTILSVGTAKITATANNHSSSFTLTAKNIPQKIKIEKINIKVGETVKAKYTVTPADAVYTNGNWRSSNTSIATVDENGNVTGVSAGTTYIYYNYEYTTVDSHVYTSSSAIVTVTK